jgi:hypothetical protein
MFATMSLKKKGEEIPSMSLDTSPSWANAAIRPMSAILARTRWQTTLYEDALAIVLPFVVTRLLLVLIGCTTALYLVPLLNPSQPIHPLPGITQVPAMFWLMWDHFDAGFYLGIARSGYWPASTLKGMSNWAFFPLYPLLVRGVALLIGTQHHSAYLLAGLIVSAGATLVAEIALYQLAWREGSRPLARRAVWLLMIFPTSFYLSAQYPEALALALSLCCCFFVRKRAWWRAGITGGLAALTHPQGVLLVLVARYEAWHMLAEQQAPYQRQATWFTSVLAWSGTHGMLTFFCAARMRHEGRIANVRRRPSSRRGDASFTRLHRMTRSRFYLARDDTLFYVGLEVSFPPCYTRC